MAMRISTHEVARNRTSPPGAGQQDISGIQGQNQGHRHDLPTCPARRPSPQPGKKGH